VVIYRRFGTCAAFDPPNIEFLYYRVKEEWHRACIFHILNKETISTQKNFLSCSLIPYSMHYTKAMGLLLQHKNRVEDRTWYRETEMLRLLRETDSCFKYLQCNGAKGFADQWEALKYPNLLCAGEYNSKAGKKRKKKNKTPYCFISTSLRPAPKCRQSTLHLTYQPPSPIPVLAPSFYWRNATDRAV